MKRVISRRGLADRWRIGVALLAAGASRRFGERDKLAEPFRGRLLGEHAAAAIPVECFAKAWIITSRKDHPCVPGWIDAGFDKVVNARAAEGMGTSVALAAELADANSCDALLIALADMPMVPQSHFAELAALSMHPQDVIVSARGDARMPPAIFGKDHFAALSGLRGDRGARDLLARGKIVPCPPEWLVDIDTPEDLRRHGQ
jgi:CTP:molybdopterin cytidylyltransferase MocA